VQSAEEYTNSLKKSEDETPYDLICVKQIETVATSSITESPATATKYDGKIVESVHYILLLKGTNNHL